MPTDPTKPFPQLSIRKTTNPEHHLWCNHGIYFCHFTIHPTALTKERVRQSLGTRDLEEAKRLRDELFVKLGATL